MGRPSPEGASVGYPLSGIPLSSEARGNGLHGRRCTMSDQPKWVIAPGGPRPPETAHHVSPGESVRYTSEGQPVVEREFRRVPSEDLVLTRVVSGNGHRRTGSRAGSCSTRMAVAFGPFTHPVMCWRSSASCARGPALPPRSERRMLPSTRTCRPESGLVPPPYRDGVGADEHRDDLRY